MSSDGSIALIGAQDRLSNQGAAYVLVRSGTAWHQESKLTLSAAVATFYFGWSVTLNSTGNMTLIGARGSTKRQGVVALFVRHRTSWDQEATFTASDAVINNGFGAAVALSSAGHTALIGAIGVGESPGPGAAYIYTANGGLWHQQQELRDGCRLCSWFRSKPLCDRWSSSCM